MSGNQYYPYGDKNERKEDQGDNWKSFDHDEMSPYDKLIQAQRESMNRQLESTRNCLTSLDESERMGAAAAEELAFQGEQLNNIEYRVDKINQDTKVSQNHLNNIKSIFGGIKNWWSGKKVQEIPQPPAPKQRQNDSLQIAERNTTLSSNTGMNARGSDTTDRSSQKQSSMSVMDHYESQLNEELDLMSNGLARLKALGTDLGQTLEEQNQQIDRIGKKADRADITIRDQNRQMKQILK